MPSLSSEARFLGVDLRALWREIRQPWLRMHDWPALAWLTPAASVRVLHPDGQQTFWLGDERQGGLAGVGKPPFVAVELPEELVLRRSLALPAMAAVDVANASALEARAISPFVNDDLAWGHRAHWLSSGNVRSDVVLASRRQIAQYLATRLDGLGDIEPEVWVLNGEGQPVVLEGYGESLRYAHALRWRRAGYALLVLIGLLSLAVMITPSLQLRFRALEAAQSYADVAKRTAPVVRQRELLMQSAEKLTLLSELVATRIEPLKVLEKLTQLLPDDTALQSFRLQGSKVTIAGMTSNSSALMQLLGNEAGFKEVRAPSAATRMGNTGKEAFSIEFQLDPQVFGAPVSMLPKTGVPGANALAPMASAPSASVSSTPRAESMPSPAASVAASAATATAAVPRPPAAQGGATFGGTAAASTVSVTKSASSFPASVTRDKP
ncbi:PilN domain-containing protein [Paracidovorax konjaci]|uniref:General secretion pathway protein L n=1 Tax=Paracidovorax konjaci TaxID=32040 RepID=A0A1I1SEN1_9BURK|nr:PilN domain-containing protein [Paracidovorax konjaci]SFD43078.1 general secretion pathway protein L [Paracidovorax konjaci]